jgi:hypothetical protein
MGFKAPEGRHRALKHLPFFFLLSLYSPYFSPASIHSFKPVR